MFTGIVEETGDVVAVTDTEGGRRIRIRTTFDDLHHGQSISVSGVCLTVEASGSLDGPDGAAFDADTVAGAAHIADSDAIADDGTVADEAGHADGARWFEVFLASETVEKTYLGTVDVGDAVNLERALAADGRFDGHLVQGHVDTTTEIAEIERVGDDWWFEFEIPDGMAQYVVSKGSVTLDGISLTVAEREADRFAVAVIPTTYELTTLSEKSAGDSVHVEVDVVAKYVESMLGDAR